ncbi:MAG TPA: hypothetical protein DD671_04445 [Balneolaceae bacterium]|nr:hypothetical protein [Balneola sp.]HBQ58878.1 hypothetical protein [Balneolaceae bacterium]|tara:strand:- start:237820 stop:238080 length:261 start_codon:yes stop_codon:yes gene_type:complete
MNTLEGETAPVLSLKDWVISLIISVIPLIGIVMLLIWAFSDNINPNKKNWARGMLILYVIGIALYFVFIVLFMGAMMSGAGGFESM